MFSHYLLFQNKLPADLGELMLDYVLIMLEQLTSVTQ